MNEGINQKTATLVAESQKKPCLAKKKTLGASLEQEKSELLLKDISKQNSYISQSTLTSSVSEKSLNSSSNQNTMPLFDKSNEFSSVPLNLESPEGHFTDEKIQQLYDGTHLKHKKQPFKYMGSSSSGSHHSGSDLPSPVEFSNGAN